MPGLDAYGVESRREVRAAVVDEEYNVIRCPCRRTLVGIESVYLAPSRFYPDAFADVDDDVLVRGWECQRSTCSRVVVETFEVADAEGRLRDLAAGWYPIRIALDEPDDDAIVFAPVDHVDDLLDRPDDRLVTDEHVLAELGVDLDGEGGASA